MERKEVNDSAPEVIVLDKEESEADVVIIDGAGGDCEMAAPVELVAENVNQEGEEAVLSQDSDHEDIGKLVKWKRALCSFVDLSIVDRAC